MPSLRSVPRGGNARVFSVESLCTSMTDIFTLLPFRSCEGASSRLLLNASSSSSCSHLVVGSLRQAQFSSSQFIYGLNRRGEGTSLLSRLTILKGDGQHRTTKIPVSWFTLGSKPPSQLVVAGPVTRHDEFKLLRKVQRTKPRN